MYMVGWLAFGGHCFVFCDGVHTLEISKMVLDPFCDEALLLLNEIINFTVFTVQDCFFFSSSCMLCFVPGFFVLNKICFEKRRSNGYVTYWYECIPSTIKLVILFSFADMFIINFVLLF